MKARLLFAGLMLAASSASAQAVPSVEALRVAEDLAAARVRYQEAHPTVVALRARERVLASERTDDRAMVCDHLRRREVALLTDDAELATRYGPRHPRVREVQARLETVRRYRDSICD